MQENIQRGDTTLHAGDRLGTSNLLHDIFDFDMLRQFPTRVLFWRASNNSIALHRNPLLEIPGWGILSICIDVLHCLYLGVAQGWVVASLWHLLRLNMWRLNRFDLTLARIKSQLFSYYKRRRGQVTPVQAVTLKMLGTSAKPARQPFKGAETKGLIDFIVDLLTTHAPISELLVAGRHLQRLIHLLDTSPIVPSFEVCSEMRRSGVQFLLHGLRGGMRPVPKMHQLLHFLHRHLRMHGNPTYNANWLDESINKDLAGIAAAAYTSVWAKRIFVCWKQMRDSRGRGLALALIPS